MNIVLILGLNIRAKKLMLLVRIHLHLAEIFLKNNPPPHRSNELLVKTTASGLTEIESISALTRSSINSGQTEAS
ncbi:MAG: hypothetical protein N3F08_06535 [Crenarchaeota archaeon]|nr:hypothetical protein [Thermoproteota archaeon]